MALALCLACETAPPTVPTPTRKYCAPCSQELRHRPRANVTTAQAALIRQMRGTMIRRDLAQHVGISQAQLHRYLTEHGLDSNARDYPPEVVATVCAAYQALGKRETQALFPDVSVRSIVERHKQYAPRQSAGRGTSRSSSSAWPASSAIRPRLATSGAPMPSRAHSRLLGEGHALCPPRYQRPGCAYGLAGRHAWRPGGARPAPAECGRATRGLVARSGHASAPGPRPVSRDAIHALARFQGWLHSTQDSADLRRFIQHREAYAH